MTRHMTKVASLLALLLLVLLSAVLVQAGRVGESVAGPLEPRLAGGSDSVDLALGGERHAGGLTNPPDKGSRRFERPLEVPDDPYLPNVPVGEDPVTGPARVWVRGSFESIQVNVDSQGANIVGDAANEPSIAIDPTDPNKVVIGWRQFDNVASNFRQGGWAYSHDGGTTWTFPGVLEQFVFRSDPVLDSDSAGNFYYYSLHAVDAGDLFISRDSGLSWEGPIPGFGGDKPWMVVDRSGGIGDGNVYAQWNLSFSCCSGDFTRSTDGGQSFLQPINTPFSPFWGTMAVGPGGELYVSGAGAIVARSLNAKDPLVATPTFDLVSGSNLGGLVGGWGLPNPGGLLGQVWIATDHSDGPTRGNVYLLASVAPDGPDPLEVMFTRSSDGGATWSAPIRVNDDPAGNGAWQWFGTMSVAPNGRIDAVWNDTRNTGDPKLSEVFYSFSLDGGLTWSANIPITPVFDSHVGWPNQDKLGDYYHMISDDVAANLAYAATFNGEQDVYFARITRDCNDNDIPDESDIANGASEDCNGNLMPDECDSQEDCNANGIQDICDVAAETSPDCNDNEVPDECDLAAGTNDDCNENGVPDECDPDFDCNANGVQDICDIVASISEDCNENEVPDECEISVEDPDWSDHCASAPAVCPGVVYTGTTMGRTIDGAASCGFSDISADVWYRYVPAADGFLSVSLCGSPHDTVLSVHTGCPGNVDNQIVCNDDFCGLQSQVGLPVTAEKTYLIRVAGFAGSVGGFTMVLSGPDCQLLVGDCNFNDVPDDCDVADGTSEDCNANQVPDECDPDLDCNDNGVQDICDVATGAGEDCNYNEIPDECESQEDCNGNGFPDICDFATETSSDCNDNGVPDECDLAAGRSDDCNENGVPDECDPDFDCNDNGLQDICDIAAGTSEDCNENETPDECDMIVEESDASDYCASAPAVCPEVVYTGTTIGRTIDGTASCASSDMSADVWYRYVPTADGWLTVSLCGSSYDTVLSVHTGCPGNVDNQIVCNDNLCGLQSQVSLPVTTEATYLIRVGGFFGSVGDFTMVLNGPDCQLLVTDCNFNNVPDECERNEDCNANDVQDICDIAAQISQDCDVNSIPDECEADGDRDGVIDSCDPCPFDLLDDRDGDGLCDSDEQCPEDPQKTEPGECGCGVSDDDDTDGDGIPDCNDECPGVDDAVFAPECTGPIPTVSGWGLTIMVLLLLAVAKIGFGRRQPTQT